MGLKPRILTFIALGIVLALLGVIVVQVVLLNDAIQLKEQAFHENVVGALSTAALRLAADETIAGVFRTTDQPVQRNRSAKGNRPRRGAGTNVRMNSVYSMRDSSRHVEVQVQEKSFTYHVGTPQWVRVHVLGTQGADSIIVDTMRAPGDYTVTLNQVDSGLHGYFYRVESDSSTSLIQVGTAGKPTLLHPPAGERERSVFVSRVLDNLWTSEKTPIDRRVSPVVLDSILRRSMRDAGITLDYTYGILTPKDSLVLVRPPEATQLLLSSPYRAPLFLMESPASRHQLVVAFSGRGLFLLSQVWPLLGASALFLALVAAGFVVTVRMLFQQQRTASLLVDFINNMTHEFKTPISTVALASEAIGRPDVEVRKGKIRQYNRMIAEEATRMRVQVDRILQMAQLEEGEVELKFGEVDLHELLLSVSKTFLLQVEAREGTIQLDLRADRHAVRGDHARLFDVFRNLLDNANKYSPARPVISVATRNGSDRIFCSVKDCGIGIAAEHQKRVFDKYYRVPTGNVHDVKGFGIGLSYVRLLVASHGGEITLRSESGKGTEVTVAFPLALRKNESPDHP